MIAAVATATGLALALAPVALASSKISSGGAVYAPAAAIPAIPAPPAAVTPPAVPALPTTATMPALTGGQVYGQVTPAVPPIVIPGTVAKILPTGYAAAPAGAPVAVQAAIFAANQIVGRAYVYGGGHQSFISVGYDCSGTVSFALHGASLLPAPMDSSDFMRWGVRGPGQWITVYTNPSHAYMTIAGIRLDTSTAGDPSGLQGPRWRPLARSSKGFHARSLPGL
jgi:cell wall-associated NlpC family hydrolase